MTAAMSSSTLFRDSLIGRLLVPAFIVASGLVASERPAAAATVVIEAAPPPMRVEVMGRAPSPAHFWIPGYWAWRQGGHVWVGGRWEHARTGYGWERARWVHEGRRWRLAPGRWHRR
jgi:hypothetical protein